MVYYSRNALEALDAIFEGLLSWPKHQLTYSHIVSYHQVLKLLCDSLDGLVHHFDASFESHKKYGAKVYHYTRTKNTTWYIIYDIDYVTNTIFIQHITSNHSTT